MVLTVYINLTRTPVVRQHAQGTRAKNMVGSRYPAPMTGNILAMRLAVRLLVMGTHAKLLAGERSQV
jgi:hypothetical protein